ncbi:hypothetical protein J132_10275 [Termitomyces sp. J132]|nr:hypothetical protein J132_10275 [Termitomyces sp. J132]
MDPPLDVPLGPQDDIPSNDDLDYVDPDYKILLNSLPLSFLFHHSLVLFSLFQEEGNLT